MAGRYYLVGVFGGVVLRSGDHDDVVLVLHIHDGEGVLVISEADLVSLIRGVWSMVVQALHIMDVTIITKTGGKGGILGV